jgi:hypothetical protein
MDPRSDDRAARERTCAMTSQPAAVSPARDQYAKPLLVALLGGCAVALALGLYARLHHPARYAVFVSLIVLWATSALWLFTTGGVHS